LKRLLKISNKFTSKNRFIIPKNRYKLVKMVSITAKIACVYYLWYIVFCTPPEEQSFIEEIVYTILWYIWILSTPFVFLRRDGLGRFMIACSGVGMFWLTTHLTPNDVTADELIFCYLLSIFIVIIAGILHFSCP